MLFYLLIIWVLLLLAILVFGIGRRGKAGPLALSYFIGLSLIHVPGILPFLASGTDFFGDLEQTEIGFAMTIVGMTAFVLGTFFSRFTDWRSAPEWEASEHLSAGVVERQGWRAFAIGFVAYFIFAPLSVEVPSLNSVVSAMATLLIAGLWLIFYTSATTAVAHFRTFAAFALLPLLPMATLVTGGFIGYGIYWDLSIIAFIYVIARRRSWFYIGTPFVVFLGLSLFVTYMGQRADIRELMWERQAGLIDRLERVAGIVTELQLFDLSSPSQAAALDARLNQNWLVGAAILRHENGLSELAHGATVTPWALIPRIVWPDKPIVGGGGDIVSDFTGIRFASGTSVGTGQVLEFYINFGLLGVVTGFFALGFLLVSLDRGIMRALAHGDTRSLILRAMPALTLLQPGGNLVEILVACAAAFVAARILLSLNIFGARMPMCVDERAI